MAGCELGEGVPRLASEIVFRRLSQISWRCVWLTPEISSGGNDRQTVGEAYLDSVFHKLKPP